jgi:two-component system LytT family response regulator
MRQIRAVIADDERPARAFLAGLLNDCEDVEVVGEASSGSETVELIERTRPDLAFLDLQMPEGDGFSVVRMIRKDRLPLVAFVTAYDEHAIRAFELNAIDYLVKPVAPARLRDTIARAHERLVYPEAVRDHAAHVKAVARTLSNPREPQFLQRIPVRGPEDITMVPVARLVSVVADGPLLHLVTAGGERHTITYRLKDLQARLDPAQFIRISRSALVNVDAIHRATALPGGLFMLTLRDGQRMPVSRIQSRVLRETLLKL